MLAVNGKPLDLTDRTNPDVKFYHECLAELKKRTGGDILLDWTTLYYAENQSDGRMRETATGFRFPMTETVLREGSNKTWTYYTGIDGKPKTIAGIPQYKPRYWKFDKATGFKGINADMELLFFIVFISPYCEKVPSMKELQNPVRKAAAYKLLLLEEEAALAVERGKKQAKITHMIYEMEDSSLRTIAKAFNIPAVDNMKENQLRQSMAREAVKNDDNMEKFLEDCNVNPHVELQANVFSALEKNIIARDNRFGKPKWTYVNKEGKLGDKICDIAGSGDDKAAKALLVDFYVNHPLDYEELKKKLNPQPVKKLNSEIED